MRDDQYFMIFIGVAAVSWFVTMIILDYCRDRLPRRETDGQQLVRAGSIGSPGIRCGSPGVFLGASATAMAAQYTAEAAWTNPHGRDPAHALNCAGCRVTYYPDGIPIDELAAHPHVTVHARAPFHPAVEHVNLRGFPPPPHPAHGRD